MAERNSEDDADSGTEVSHMLHNNPVPSATTRDWRLFNVVLLGVTFLFVFTAFQTCSMVETLVLEGAKVELNDTDGSKVGNGYTSLSILYCVFAASNWIAPAVVFLLGPKWSLFAGACTYCLFIGFFLLPMAISLYITSVLIGMGAAVIWTAQGNFLTINSTEDTMMRNTCIFWVLLQGSLLFGNLIVYFLFADEKHITAESRTPLFIILTAVSITGVLLMLFFCQRPTAEAHTDAIAEQPGLLQAFINSWRLVATKEMALLIVCFAYTGLELSFWSAVFITSVGHISEFPSAKRLTGLSGMFVGAGEILAGLLFGILGNFAKQRRPGRDSVLLIGYIAHMVTFYLIFITFPADSPLQESEMKPYYTPRQFVVYICSFLLGFGDSCYNTQIYPIIAALFATNSAPAFAFFKFIQSLASAATFVYSMHLLIHWQLFIMVVFATVGTVMFFEAERLAIVQEKTAAAKAKLAIQSSS